MKRLFSIILLGCCILLLLLGMWVGANNNKGEIVAHADSPKNVEKELQEEINKGLDDLINEDIEQFFNDLESQSKFRFGSTFKEFVARIIKGESFDINMFFDMIWEGIKGSIYSIITYLATIVILSILYGLSKNLSSGFIKESTSQIIYYAVYAAIIAILCAMINGIIMSAKVVINSISALVEIAFPILITLVAALGGTASAAVYQPITLIFTKVVVNIVDLAIMPMFYATIVFSIVGNISSNIKLEKLTKAIQSIASWTLGIVFAVTITLITSQGIVGASIDSISIKSAKFALSSYVPILGGYLSEGFDIVLASAVLLKNALGLAAVIILFLLILMPVIKIILSTLLLKLTAGIVEPLSSDSRISNLLYSTSKNLGILISIVLGMAFLAFILFMLIIYTCNLGVI